MSVQELLKNVDKGFYQQARSQGVTPGRLLFREVEPEPPEVDPVYHRLLKKYEAEDNGNYRSREIREFAEEVTALEKCFEVSRISLHDTVERAFFSSTDTTQPSLFPLFLATEIIAGQLAVSLVPRLVAMVQRINSHVAEKVTMTETAGDRTLKFTGEGAAMPKTKLSAVEGTVKLYKYGRVLEYTYEAARLQALDVIGLFLQRMGMQLGIDQTDDLIEVLLAGDGTANSAAIDVDAEVSGVFDFDELLRLLLSFPVGYRGTEGVINSTNLRTVFNMAEFRDPLGPIGVSRMTDIERVPILGMNLNRWDSTGSSTFSTDRVLVVDPRLAIKELREGDFMEESDRIIDRQLNQRAMSEWRGWAKLDLQASHSLDIVP